MEETLKIIYTPEVAPFTFEFALSEEQRYVGDPEVQKLRTSYAKLRERVNNLPERVGVITYHRIAKGALKRLREEAADYPTLREKGISSYPALDVIQEILDMRKLDFNDPINNFFAYRNIMLLASCPFLTIDRGTEINKRYLMLASAIPDRYIFGKASQETATSLREKAKDVPEIAPLADSIVRAVEEINSAIPDWDVFKNMYEQVKRRFEKNKVSRNFPLYAAPIGWFMPLFYLVSLEEGVDKPSFIDDLTRMLEAGCRASGLSEIPPEHLREINRYNKERFGKTKTLQSLDRLLGALPQRKVIITDIHIVDAIPQLAERPFDAIELKFE